MRMIAETLRPGENDEFRYTVLFVRLRNVNRELFLVKLTIPVKFKLATDVVLLAPLAIISPLIEVSLIVRFNASVTNMCIDSCNQKIGFWFFSSTKGTF